MHAFRLYACVVQRHDISSDMLSSEQNSAFCHCMIVNISLRCVSFYRVSAELVCCVEEMAKNSDLTGLMVDITYAESIEPHQP